MNYSLDLCSVKRVLVAILFFSSSCAVDARLKKFNPQGSEIDIKHFGAKGDGVSDDYPAFLAAADYINKNGGGTLIISKGTYFLAPYYTKEKPVRDITFKQCTGLNIIGQNAVISVNGQFHRGVTSASQYKFSTTREITPLRIVNCRDVTITGIEINGNVDKMTKDPGVVEGGGYLLSIQQCENVTLSNLVLHHSMADGIYIGGGSKPTINLKMFNCTSRNNARQGLSITFLYNGRISNCRFLNTGITDGKYGRHGPAAGVDIEPNQTSPKTGKIILDSCYFENNQGGQFLCTAPRSTSNVILKNSQLIAKESNSRYQVIIAADSVLVENCEMDLGKGNFWPTWKQLPGSHVTISKCVIKSSNQGILSSSLNEKDKVTIINTSLFFTGDTLKSYFPYLQTRNLSFLNNNIYIPSASIKSNKVTSLVQGALVAKGNKFYSDNKNVKPMVSYQGTKEVQDH